MGWSKPLHALSSTLVPALLLAFLHQWAAHLHPRKYIDRKYWISFADGVSITYIFLRLLPEITHLAQHPVHPPAAPYILSFPPLLDRVADWGSHHPFLPLLIGFTVFYGLERWMYRPVGQPAHDAVRQRIHARVHIAGLALYMLLLGYLLAQMRELADIVIFTVAMMMHFLVVDFHLVEMHQRAYMRIGRWVLTVAFLLGWAASALVAIERPVLAMLISFVSGGAVLMIIQDEFSEASPNSFGTFVLAEILYAALLLQF